MKEKNEISRKRPADEEHPDAPPADRRRTFTEKKKNTSALDALKAEKKRKDNLKRKQGDIFD